MITSTDSGTLSLGLLAGRLVFGTLIAVHGTQKLFGWFGGHGLAGTAGFFESLGFRPGRFFAAAAAMTELTGGLLILLGLLGPVGPALVLSVMIVAAGSVHWKNGVFAAANGIEVPLLYATGALVVALAGPGRFSVDAILGLDRVWTPTIEWVAIAVGVLAGMMNLALRRAAPQPSHAS